MSNLTNWSSLSGQELYWEIDRTLKKFTEEGGFFYIQFTGFNEDNTYNITFQFFNIHVNEKRGIINANKDWVFHWLAQSMLSLSKSISGGFEGLWERSISISETVAKQDLEAAGDRVQLAALQQQIMLQQKHIDLLQESVLALQH